MSEELAAHALARNTLVVGGVTFGSRLLGFVRDCLIAAFLGAGAQADALFVAFRIPNVFRRLFAEGAFALTIVTEYTRITRNYGTEQAFAVIRACAVLFGPVLAAATVLACWQAEAVTRLIAPGFVPLPDLFAQTTSLLQLALPYGFAACAVALCGAMLNACGHFIVPALAPGILNVTLIAVGTVSWWLGLPLAVAFCYGLVAGGVLQFTAMQPVLRRRGFRWRGPWRSGVTHAISIGRQLGPSVFGAAIYQLSVLLVTLLASLLAAGSISALSYADRLVQFPLGVFGLAVGTAALPELSSLAAKGERVAFNSTLFQAGRLTAYISFPAAAGLAGLAVPIVELLFGRGAFSGDDVTATAAALCGYAPGIPALALLRPLLAACHARQDIRSPMLAGGASLLVTGLVSVALLPVWQHVALAFAVSVGAWVNMLLLHGIICRREGKYIPAYRIFAGYALLAACILGAARYFASWGQWGLIGIPLLCIAYFAVSYLMGSPDIRLLYASFCCRKKD